MGYVIWVYIWGSQKKSLKILNTHTPNPGPAHQEAEQAEPLRTHFCWPLNLSLKRSCWERKKIWPIYIYIYIYIYWSLLQHYDKWLINSPAIRYLLHHYSFRWYGFPLNHSSNSQWLKRLSFNEHVLRLFIVVNLGIMLTLVVHALLSLKVSHSSKQVAWYFGRSSSTIFL